VSEVHVIHNILYTINLGIRLLEHEGMLELSSGWSTGTGKGKNPENHSHYCTREWRNANVEEVSTTILLLLS